LNTKEHPEITPPDNCLQIPTIDETLESARKYFITDQNQAARREISELLSKFTVSGNETARATTIQEAEVPPVGETSTEATVSEWYVETGDAVRKGEKLATVQTEGTLSTLSMPVKGRIKERKVETGDQIAVGSVIITFEGTNEDSQSDRTSITGGSDSTHNPSRIELTVADSELTGSVEVECPNCEANPDSAQVTRGMVCQECEGGYLCVSGTVVEFTD
jgi:biotin carboxyl carrier protein